VLLAQALFSNPDILLLDEPTNNLDIDTIRWLEQTLNDRDSTMIIISHDRHFLNMVCTHMADLDYGELRVYPGNYDEYMTAATQARERLLADNAKKKAQIADLQSSSAALAPTPLNRVRRPRVRVRLTKSSWKKLKPPAVRTRSSASSRTRNCSVTRWKWKPLPKALRRPAV
jgi:ATPase subunit of ABC transporter with duplicated ATPase domains